MLHIFICEDNPAHNHQIESCAKNCVIIHNLEVDSIVSMARPEDLLSVLKDKGGTGLYFLDIHLNDKVDGLKLAMAIREYDPRGYIAFITSHGEELPMTFKYKVEAMDFILKDNFLEVRDRIHACILYAYQKHLQNANKRQARYCVKLSDKYVTVEYNDIKFFESFSNHKVLLHATYKTYEYAGSLGAIAIEIGDSFYRCHRSFLINLHNIDYLDTKLKLAYFKQGGYCLISKRKMKPLMELINKRIE